MGISLTLKKWVTSIYIETITIHTIQDISFQSPTVYLLQSVVYILMPVHGVYGCMDQTNQQSIWYMTNTVTTGARYCTMWCYHKFQPVFGDFKAHKWVIVAKFKLQLLPAIKVANVNHTVSNPTIAVTGLLARWMSLICITRYNVWRSTKDTLYIYVFLIDATFILTPTLICVRMWGCEDFVYFHGSVQSKLQLQTVNITCYLGNI